MCTLTMNMSDPALLTSPNGRLYWTAELHSMFLDAVKTLGPNATPAAIKKEMKVAGLSRQQIGSHWQHYKRDYLKIQKTISKPEISASKKSKQQRKSQSDPTDLSSSCSTVPSPSSHSSSSSASYQHLDRSPSSYSLADSYESYQSLMAMPSSQTAASVAAAGIGMDAPLGLPYTATANSVALSSDLEELINNCISATSSSLASLVHASTPPSSVASPTIVDSLPSSFPNAVITSSTSLPVIPEQSSTLSQLVFSVCGSSPALSRSTFCPVQQGEDAQVAAENGNASPGRVPISFF